MKLKNSLNYLERAKKVIPVCSQTFYKGYTYFPQGAYPVYIKSGKRGYVFDVDRNIYSDYIMALGTITLGYSYPKVNEAIRLAETLIDKKS